MTDKREAIAYHEAGHALISMKLGYACLYVTIIPDGDRLGHVCCEDPMVVGRGSKIEDALKVLMAASLSEGFHRGRKSWGDIEDRLVAKKLALLACNQNADQAQALINEMVCETRQLVESHWSEIETLAQRLLTQGKVNLLSGEENVTANSPTYHALRAASMKSRR
jgi:hypothetical protein